MDQYDDFEEGNLDSFDGSSSKCPRAPSPPSLPQAMFLKRSNPKRLSLTLTMPLSTSPSETFTPTYSTDSTPYTPGPPKTPALATAALARQPAKANRKPSLLTLNTKPANFDDVPPTPGGNIPYQNGRPPARLRLRSSTEIQDDSGPSYRPASPPLNPLRVAGWRDRKEHSLTLPPFGNSYQSSSSDTSSRTSVSSSSASTPSSSPPLPSFGIPLCSRPEPYSSGPVEVVPNVFLGAEDSATDLAWAKRFKTLRVINVAQEIENPFMSGSAKGKGKVAFGEYQAVNGTTDVEYCHLRWSHGESGLAEIPRGSSLSELIEDPKADLDAASWGIWNAVKWLEQARREGQPVLIHCQCGVSRSATLLIAYLMCLAAAGLMPEHLGHLSRMQDTYDFVKHRSPCIGPNVSLIFQLVELQRALTALLSEHVSQPGAKPIDTSFPTMAAQALSEAEWARKRAEFDDEESANESDSDKGAMAISPLSPEQAGDEARRLDQAMMDRHRSNADARGAVRLV